MHSFKKRSRKSKRLIKGFILIIVGLSIIFVSLDTKLRPIITTYAKNRAVSISTLLINKTVTDLLSIYDIDYNNIVQINTDESGIVTSVNTNMMILNKIKADITSQVQTAINKYDKQIISIPIGTIIGGDLFIGRGPSIKIHLDISSSIESEITNAFDSAGINQTRHQIMLVIKTNVYVIIPWYKTSTQVITNFCLAETIIVGEVPDSFTNVNTIDGDIPGLINDYSNDK